VNQLTWLVLEIVSGVRKGQIASIVHNSGDEETQTEEKELCKEIEACITRLFRTSSLIRRATPTDVFANALSRSRCRFNDQFDIAHVGEVYPKLDNKEYSWLKEKLGRAITNRRHYLRYIQDHREQLEQKFEHTPEEIAESSHPSTFITKISSLIPGHITSKMITATEESDTENDTRSYTTMSRSMDGDLDSLATVRVPKLNKIPSGSKKEVECPFCYRIEKFENERAWRHHVFSDLRAYVCTFPNCDAPYFRDINEWFHHEMQSHRVSYTCQLCQSKTFQSRENYIAHIQKRHPEMAIEDDEQLLIDMARKPLRQIPAQECPCCSEWLDRLKERAGMSDLPSSSSENILYVLPEIFKRHLASHLEQLASFAIPIGSSTDDDINSQAAIEGERITLPGGSQPSTLALGRERESTELEQPVMATRKRKLSFDTKQPEADTTSKTKPGSSSHNFPAADNNDSEENRSDSKITGYGAIRKEVTHKNVQHRPQPMEQSSGPTFRYTEVWYCCRCPNSGATTVQGTPACPYCGHYMCHFCSREQVKLPVSRVCEAF
jgi:hypothetical protein